MAFVTESFARAMEGFLYVNVLYGATAIAADSGPPGGMWAGSGGSQINKFSLSGIRSAFGRRITSILWLGFIEIDKIMMKLIYFFGPHFFVASL
jgi:hypothetical protein